MKDNQREISAIKSQRHRDIYRVKKSLKVLRTGKPARRIFTVSNIPEYLSWFRTTSGSNTLGFYKSNNNDFFNVKLILILLRDSINVNLRTDRGVKQKQTFFMLGLMQRMKNGLDTLRVAMSAWRES